MSRSNVGTPKFYIDYLQYWDAKGLIHAVGPYAEHSEHTPTEYGIDWLNETVQGGSAYYPELIGLKPSNYMDVFRFPYEEGLLLYFYYFIALKERVYLPDSGKLWYGALNHNFFDIGCSFSSLNVYKGTGGTFYSGIDLGFDPNELSSQFDTGSDWWEPYNISSTSSGATRTEICNCPADITSIGYNGFSIIEFENQTMAQTVNQYTDTDINDDDGNYLGSAYEYGEGFDMIIQGMKLDMSNPDFLSGGQDEVRAIQGSLNFGGVYEMPHSPELGLTMTREYTGVDMQESLSGYLFRNIRHTGTPNWRNDLPAWSLTTRLTDEIRAVQPSSRGRRIWDLTFSHVGNDDIFALNESQYISNPTDSATNGGYDSGDFDDNNDFAKHIGSDDSFFGMVIEKTMGGALPFIFQPDGNNNSPDQFAICHLDSESISVKQVAHSVYEISLKIKEVW